MNLIITYLDWILLGIGGCAAHWWLYCWKEECVTPEANNAVRSIANKLLSELRSKDNKSALRQLLDKYASQVKPF